MPIARRDRENVIRRHSNARIPIIVRAGQFWRIAVDAFRKMISTVLAINAIVENRSRFLLAGPRSPRAFPQQEVIQRVMTLDVLPARRPGGVVVFLDEVENAVIVSIVQPYTDHRVGRVQVQGIQDNVARRLEVVVLLSQGRVDQPVTVGFVIEARDVDYRRVRGTIQRRTFPYF